MKDLSKRLASWGIAMKPNRRSFFGWLAGLFCLPWVPKAKAKAISQVKPDTILYGHIGCTECGHVNCFYAPSINVAWLLSQLDKGRSFTWHRRCVGQQQFFEIHVSRSIIPPYGSPYWASGDYPNHAPITVTYKITS